MTSSAGASSGAGVGGAASHAEALLARLAPVRPGGRAGAPPIAAWDAADTLALDHLLGDPRHRGFGAGTETVAVVDDVWGALTCCLAGPGTYSVCDSAAGAATIRFNLERSGGVAEVVSRPEALPDRLDLVVMRIPRSLTLFEARLRGIAPRLHAQTVIVAAAMVKHLPRRAHEVADRVIGPTRPSLTRRKARLLLIEVGSDRSPGVWPWPRSREQAGVTLVDHPGVFSAGRSDPGTALLLAHPPAPVPHEGDPVVDLGCGNGVLATSFALGDPRMRPVFVDDSAIAVASAQDTWRATHGDRPARFVHGDALGDAVGVEPGSVALVVCNPPFHERSEITDEVAWRMFTGAHRVLRSGGELRVVGNRHLGYHAKLRRIFGNVTVLGSDPRFVALSARR